MTRFELAVQDHAGLRTAAQEGVDRIELCAALAIGGVTPSAGFIAAAVAAGVPAHVLIRSRGGGFEYSSEECTLARDDARRALDLGAAGVVVGGLREGAVDVELIEGIVADAGGADVTFHRAFDVVDDVPRALEVLIDCGVSRILTSGGANRASDAPDALRTLVERASGRIQIMAGGGVTSSTLSMITATGVDAVHSSAKRHVTDAVGVALGSLVTDAANTRETVDPAEVRRIVRILGANGEGR